MQTNIPENLLDITLDLDDEWQINSERTVDVGVEGVKFLPELFGIDLLIYPDTYFTSVAVIDPYRREVVRIVNFVGGTEEFDGRELPIVITDQKAREELFHQLRVNSPKDAEEKFMDFINDSIEYFAEEDEDLGI